MKYAKGFGGSFYCSLREEFCSISELKNRIKEVDEVIKYFTNLHQQTDFTCLAVKYLNELRIEILGEIERREGKPVINGIHVEKMCSFHRFSAVLIPGSSLLYPRPR